MCELKSKMNTLLQDYYEEYNRMNESHIQQKCESDLELRSLISTIRDNEKNEKENSSDENRCGEEEEWEEEGEDGEEEDEEP